MKDTSFVRCLNKSKNAANRLISYIKRNGYEVEDLQNNRDYYKKDIDLLIKDKEDRDIYVEVKTDFYDYKKNVCVETISNINTNKPGWIHYTEAEYIIYYLVNFSEIYVIKTEDLKELITTNDYEKKYTETTDKKNREIYFGEILLMPITDLETKSRKYII